MKVGKKIQIASAVLLAVLGISIICLAEETEVRNDSVTGTASGASEEGILIIGDRPQGAIPASDVEVSTDSDHTGSDNDSDDENRGGSDESEVESESEGNRVYRVHWRNTTDRGIVGVQIKNIYDGSYPDNMIPEGQILPDGGEAELYYDASQEDEGAEFNIRITFEDGEEKDITSYPFSDMEEGELHYDDGLLHVTYTSLSTGEKTDTLEREKSLRETAQKAKEAASSGPPDQSSNYNNTYSDNTGGAYECIREDAVVW